MALETMFVIGNRWVIIRFDDSGECEYAKRAKGRWEERKGRRTRRNGQRLFRLRHIENVLSRCHYYSSGLFKTWDAFWSIAHNKKKIPVYWYYAILKNLATMKFSMRVVSWWIQWILICIIYFMFMKSSLVYLDRLLQVIKFGWKPGKL